VIVGSILSVVVLLVHIFAGIKIWARSSDMSHTHVFNISMPICTGIIFLAIAFWVLGRWVSKYCTCCETAACQPDPLDFTNVARFHIAWTIMVIVNVIWLYTVMRALFSHMYPERKVPTTADPTRTSMPLNIRRQQEQADALRPVVMKRGKDVVNTVPVYG
jgi:heme/copper-type cytochrome/quinol oxidase subunit 2